MARKKESLDEKLAHPLAPTGDRLRPTFNPTTPDGETPPNLPLGPSPGVPLQAYGPVKPGPEGTNEQTLDDHVPAAVSAEARDEHAVESSKSGTEAPEGDDQSDQRDYSGLEPAFGAE